MLLQDVPGSAGNLTDNCPLFPHQAIQQTGFTGIGRTAQNHPQSIPQQLAPTHTTSKIAERGFQIIQLPQHLSIGQKIDKVVGIDARGFIFASPVALNLEAGFVPVRKKGKLPWDTHERAYSLEYGENIVEIHKDAILPGESVLLIDDLLATGGTAAAAIKLIQQLEANLVAASFLIELTDLNGRELLGDVPINAVISY